MTDEEKNLVADLLAKAEEKKKSTKTVTGEVMAQGGGAVVGGTVGYIAGGVAAAALAPFTGGLSVLIPIVGAIAGGAYGHKKSQDID